MAPPPATLRRVIVPAILIGLAANADNLSIGIAYGIQGRNIRPVQNLLVAGVTTAVTLAALLAGRAVHRHLLSAVSNWLGGAILILLALAALARPAKRNSQAIYGGAVGWVDVAVLSASLSINNIGLAIAGGLANLPRVPLLASVFCFSVAMLCVGQVAGSQASRRVTGALSQAWIGNVGPAGGGVDALVRDVGPAWDPRCP